ncbi:MAG: hypothetical protein WBW04_20195 [Nitrolancea sp.]
MDSNEFDVRRTVVSVLEQCSNCKQQYSLDDARVIERQGELWVLSVHCSHCEAQAYVAAVVDGEGAEVDEMNRADEPDSEGATEESVSVDDVLDLHEFLDTFDGDFAALFHRRRR